MDRLTDVKTYNCSERNTVGRELCYMKVSGSVICNQVII